MDLTIFVPTKNRLYYIAKFLSYYSSINFKGQLIILDSSDENISNEISKLILNKKNLRIKHFHSIGLPCALMKKYIEQVKTNYVVFSGDDDYFVKDGLKACLNFLENNLDYIGCTGEGISVHSSTDKKIDFILDYSQAKIKGETSKERLSQLFIKYKVPIFSIFRTVKYKLFLEPVPSAIDQKNICPDKAIADEYILEAAMVAYGNIQKLKNPYLVRHIHQGRNIDNLVPDFKKDWINTSNYKISLNYFNIKMSKIISDIDKINSIKALEFFKEIYDKHLVYELKREEKFFTNKIFSKILNKISFFEKSSLFFN